eukprot:SM000106S13936  [mRNA]  locus=s106:72126:74524:- [translate_table: standard]
MPSGKKKRTAQRRKEAEAAATAAAAGANRALDGHATSTVGAQSDGRVNEDALAGGCCNSEADSACGGGGQEPEDQHSEALVESIGDNSNSEVSSDKAELSHSDMRAGNFALDIEHPSGSTEILESVDRAASMHLLATNTSFEGQGDVDIRQEAPAGNSSNVEVKDVYGDGMEASRRSPSTADLGSTCGSLNGEVSCAAAQGSHNDMPAAGPAKDSELLSWPAEALAGKDEGICAQTLATEDGTEAKEAIENGEEAPATSCDAEIKDVHGVGEESLGEVSPADGSSKLYPENTNGSAQSEVSSDEVQDSHNNYSAPSCAVETEPPSRAEGALLSKDQAAASNTLVSTHIAEARDFGEVEEEAPAGSFCHAGVEDVLGKVTKAPADSPCEVPVESTGSPNSEVSRDKVQISNSNVLAAEGMVDSELPSWPEGALASEDEVAVIHEDVKAMLVALGGAPAIDCHHHTAEGAQTANEGALLVLSSLGKELNLPDQQASPVEEPGPITSPIKPVADQLVSAMVPCHSLLAAFTAFVTNKSSSLMIGYMLSHAYTQVMTEVRSNLLLYAHICVLLYLSDSLGSLLCFRRSNLESQQGQGI